MRMRKSPFSLLYIERLIRIRINAVRYWALGLILIFHVSSSFAQYQKNEDPKPWWEFKDTSSFTPTGYLGASFGFINDDGQNFDPAFFLSCAEPLWKSFMGIAGRIGYNAIPAASANTWFRQYYIAAGPFLTYQLNKKYAFDLRLLGGLMYCRYPEQIYLNHTTTSNNGSPLALDSTTYYTFDIKSSNAFAFFYQAGLGFRFSLIKRTGIIFNADYMWLRADFNSTITTNITGATVNEYNTSNGSTVATRSYQFSPAPITYPLTIEPTDQHHNGYFLFTLGLYYRLGDPLLAKEF